MKKTQIIIVAGVIILLIVTNFLTVRYFHKKGEKQTDNEVKTIKPDVTEKTVE